MLQFAGHSVITATGFAVLPIGAGGFLSNVSIANDDTIVVRTDTYGEYLWNGASWVQLATTLTMVNGTDIGQDANGDLIEPPYGCYEICIAPSNSQILYKMYNGYVYKSTNQGGNWTRTAFTQRVFGDSNYFNSRRFGSRMAIHPTDPNTVVATTQSNGAFYTTDGGSNWTAISGITNPTTNGPGMLVTFDPTNGNTVSIASAGVGVYQSTTGVAGTFSAISSGTPPTLKNFRRLYHDKYSRLWALTDSGTHVTYLYSGGTWTNKNLGSYTNRVYSIVASPSTANNIWAAMDGGDIITSTNAGSSWTDPNIPPIRVAGGGEPGWFSQTLENSMTNGNMVTTSTGRIIFAEGIGAWYTDSPGATTTWNSMSKGIEQLVVNKIISPPSGVPITSCWDRPVFRLPSLTAYPANHGINYTQSIMHGWGCDYAKSDPTCIVVHATDNGGAAAGGKSTDGGQNWVLFAKQPVVLSNVNTNASTASGNNTLHFTSGTVPADIFVGMGLADQTAPFTQIPSGTGVVSWTATTVVMSANATSIINSGDPILFGSSYGGGIAAATNQNFVVIHGSSPQTPRYTLDGGTTWASSTVTGVTDGWQDGNNALHRQIITCDYAGVFYAYNSGTNPGVYKSTDGGVNFTKVFTGHMAGASTAGADGFNAQLEAVPGASYTGRLVYTSGDSGGSIFGAFTRSTDSGVTWAAISNVTEVKHFGFGKAKPGGGGHPTVFIVGWLSGVYGVYRSDDFEQATPTWTLLGTFPLGRSDIVTTVCGDINTYNTFYIGYRGSGAISGVF
jgi:hypothetical protein